MMATPPSLSTVFTSLKSRFISPCTVIISAMLRAATLSVSSALPKASSTVSSGYISRSRSLLMTSSASTCFDISSTPSRAWSILRGPSKRKGMVTMPTVSMPISLLTRAMTGAAPVPVPPPMPAVMKAIFVPSLSMALMSSRLSSAAWRAFSGLFPAPRPSLPSCRCTGTGESLSAWLSVLQSTKRHVVYAFAVHVVHGVASAAAHSDHLYYAVLLLGEAEVNYAVWVIAVVCHIFMNEELRVMVSCLRLTPRRRASCRSP